MSLPSTRMRPNNCSLTMLWGGFFVSDDNQRRHIVLAGAYGIQNAGDDAPLLVLREGLVRQQDKLTVLTRHVLPFDKQYYAARFLKNPEYSNREEAAGKWFRGMNPTDETFGLRRIRAVIKNCDLLVLGAGNAFIDVAIDTLKGPVPLLALYCFLAEVYRKPVMFYGLSVGPLRTAYGRDLARWMLDSAAVVTVRDVVSLEYARRTLNVRSPVHVLPDPVLGLKAKPLDEYTQRLVSLTHTSKYTIGLGLRDISRLAGTQVQDKILDELAAFVRAWSTRARFVSIPNSTYPEDDDRQVAAELQRRVPDCELVTLRERLHPGQIVSAYEACDLAVTIRLHAAVFAVMAGVPVLGIAYLPKVRGFFETLEKGGKCLELEEVTAERIEAHCYKFLSETGEITTYFQRYQSEERQMIKRYFTLAEGAIGDRGIHEDEL